MECGSKFKGYCHVLKNFYDITILKEAVPSMYSFSEGNSPKSFLTNASGGSSFTTNPISLVDGCNFNCPSPSLFHSVQKPGNNKGEKQQQQVSSNCHVRLYEVLDKNVAPCGLVSDATKKNEK